MCLRVAHPLVTTGVWGAVVRSAEFNIHGRGTAGEARIDLLDECSRLPHTQQSPAGTPNRPGSPEGVDPKTERLRESEPRSSSVSPHTMSFQKLLPWIGILLLPAIFYLALAGEGSNE